MSVPVARTLSWLAVPFAVGLVCAARGQEAPVAQPAWFGRLPANRRPPLPLRDGLRFGEAEGEYRHVQTGIAFVWVSPGTFRMGDDVSGPVHDVRFAEGFWLGKHEVTIRQYRSFCATTKRAEPEMAPFAQGDDHPVVNVSWDDATAFCQWAGLRLPSEAEWEYAARGSEGRVFPWGDQDPDATRCNLYDASCPEKLWWGKAAFQDGHPHTAPVGSFPAGASPSGALDLAGNVFEWVEDEASRDYAADPSDGSPRASMGLGVRVYRGGSWATNAGPCRAASRTGDLQGLCDRTVGFRPALGR